LTTVQRWMIFFAGIFALGMCYIILLQGRLNAFLRWRSAWIAALIIWAVLVGASTWVICSKLVKSERRKARSASKGLRE